MTGAVLPERPYTILLYTMGGQGGAGVESMASKGGRVLCNWIVDAAHAAGYPVQSTLTPGTGQRTGLNNLYIEIYPVEAKELGGRKPVFRLAPRPGDLDLVVAYELVEAGRALTQGLVSMDRTTLIASTHRFYTVAEKAVTTDGRIDSAAIVSAAQSGAKQAVLFDMAETCRSQGGSVNAVALGAIATLESFPIATEHLKTAIRHTLDGINTAEQNLAAFAAGRTAADAGDVELPTDETAKRPTRDPAASLQKRIDTEIPREVQEIVRQGTARVLDFQNLNYANDYLDYLAPIRELDDGGPDNSHALVRETARYLALWMSYDDVIRVADLKSRAARRTRITEEVGADGGKPLRITEFFKPGLDEWTAMLPAPLGRTLRGAAIRLGLRHRLNLGLHIPSTSIWGYLLLRTVARLRFLRRSSLGMAEETARIKRWLQAIGRAAGSDYGLAVEIAECGRLIKGYGETRERAYEKFERVFEKLVQPALEGSLHSEHAGPPVSEARAAAFADPDGETFDAKLDEIAAAANSNVATAGTGSAND